MAHNQKQSEQQIKQSNQVLSEKLAKYDAWLEPFKLYVEWSEMHKLRAQLQLVSDELAKANNDATSVSALLEDASKQKKHLEERYQDALLTQSESISYLERGLAAFKKLDDAKFKRLKRICESLKEFQAQGRVGEAEQDRGDELVKELRLLAVAKGVPVEISFESDKPAKRGILNWGRKSKTVEKEVVSFEELELAEQSRYLEKLAQRYANVFDYRRDLSKQLRALRRRIKEESSIGDELPSFQDHLKLAKNELRDQLKAELTEIDQSLEKIQQGLETKALTRALKVTTQILDAALPNKHDVKEIRDHHRMLLQQTQAFSAAPKKQKAVSKKRSSRGKGKLEQQNEALEEFVSTYNSYQRFVEDDVRRGFAAQIADLKRASQDNRYDLEMISEGHRFAAVFEASALMQSHDERSMQKEQLQEWIVELRAMPRVDELRQKFHDTLRGLQGLSERMNHEDISPEKFETTAASVQVLRDDLKVYLEKDQDHLEQQVSLLNDEGMKQQLELAQHDLGKNNFSSVVDIHYQIRLACDRALSEQLSELHRLEAESDQLLISDDASDVDALHDHLDHVREEIEAGHITQALPKAWELLEKARSQHDDWIIKFEARLDRLITNASKVAFLNTSSSFKLVSLLSHLDEQRDVFPKVSIRARRRLEDSLETAKEQLRQLRKEQKMAQSLAEEFVKDNPLDNMFGNSLGDTALKGDALGDSAIAQQQVSALDTEDESDLESLESSFDMSLNEVLDSSYQEEKQTFSNIEKPEYADDFTMFYESDNKIGAIATDKAYDELETSELEPVELETVELETASELSIAASSVSDIEDVTFQDISSDMADDVKVELDLQESGELHLTEVRNNYPSLDRWLDDYLQDGSVRDVLIYSREGNLLAAKSWLDPDSSLDSFSLVNNVAKSIGRSLGLGRYHLASVETSTRVFLGVRLRGGSSMILLLDNNQSIQPVSNRLRRDIPTLGRMIHEVVLT